MLLLEITLHADSSIIHYTKVADDNNKGPNDLTYNLLRHFHRDNLVPRHISSSHQYIDHHHIDIRWEGRWLKEGTGVKIHCRQY